MKSIRRAATILVVAVAGFAAISGRAGAQDDAKREEKSDSSRLYTSCNIWFEKNPISSINYKTGAIIPAGTEVRDVQFTERGRVRKVREIQFTTVKDGASYAITYESRYSPNLTMAQVRDRFISNKTLEELTEGMNEKEIDCVKTGVLREGISRQAVLVAYGYPPAHKTPSLDMNTWTYWTNRYREKPIYFGEDGRTSRGRVISGDEL